MNSEAARIGALVGWAVDFLSAHAVEIVGALCGWAVLAWWLAVRTEGE